MGAISTHKSFWGAKDIKDRKIPIKMVTQPVGALGEFAGRQLLRAYGITYNDIKAWGGSTQHVGYNIIVDAFKDGRAVGYNIIVDAFKDGRADALFAVIRA